MTSIDAQADGRRRGRIQVCIAYLVALGVAWAVARWVSGQHPIVVAALADVAATGVVFAFSLRHDNSSFYDPYWSLAPIPIVLYWATVNPGGVGLREILVVGLVVAWGLRLTANWWARWHGGGDEDFRYVEIRRKTGRWYWPASFVSIHLMPTAWVFLGLLPTYPALSTPGPAFGPVDWLAAAVTLTAIAIETVSDLQLRRFLRTRRDAHAVLNTGLWAWSRHPNYFGEVLFWWGLFFFGLAAAPGSLWPGAGALSITLLFVLVSVPWMDRRMLSRHPEWADHLKSTSALVPWPPRRS